MRIDVRNQKHERLFKVEITLSDPPGVVRSPAEGDQQEVHLSWDQAIDDGRYLCRCPVCGCRELFARKDFHQVTGLVIVIGAAVTAMVLFLGMREVMWGFGVLMAAVLIDAIVYLFVGRCLVCYRCRSEFRDLDIPRHHPGWDLSIGEKYRASDNA